MVDRSQVSRMIDSMERYLDIMEARQKARNDAEDILDPLDAPVQAPISDQLPVRFEPGKNQEQRIANLWGTKTDSPLEMPKENLWEGHPPLPIEHI
jgi:hypothetical protein